MENDGMPLYWYLFYNKPTILNDLDLYQRKHFGCNIEKPPQPKQKPIEIPVSDDSEELRKLMEQSPRTEGRGGY